MENVKEREKLGFSGWKVKRQAAANEHSYRDGVSL